MPPAICPKCGGSESDSYENSLICLACGWVLEESNIVVEQTFSESAGGSSVADGQFVSATGSSFRGMRGVNRESREITLENAKRRISSMAGSLGLTAHHTESAFRLFLLALQHNFVRGRKSEYVISSCLYVVCRREKTAHMLIDFADVLNVPLYYLGHTFLDFCSLLNLQLPVIDPSLYIERFAAKLGFGDKTHAVANTALRLVQRMRRDWIITGRRPAGICGAALVIAARIHGFKRNVDEVVRVVRICDVTIRKRLTEFESTGASELTPAEFEVVELEREMDPPCFTRGVQREKERLRKRKALQLAKKREQEEAAAQQKGNKKPGKRTTKKSGRRKSGDGEEQEEESGKGRAGKNGKRQRRSREAEEEGDEEEEESEEGKGKEKVGDEEDGAEPTAAKKRKVESTAGAAAAAQKAEDITKAMEDEMEQMMQQSEVQQLDADLNARSAQLEELEEFSASAPDGSTSTQQLSQREAPSRSGPPSSVATGYRATDDPAEQVKDPYWQEGEPFYWENTDDGGKLEELDEDELEGYLRSPDEVKLTTEVWEEMNKDWLEAYEEKKKQEAIKWPNGKPASAGRKRSRNTGPKVIAATAAEAVATTLAKKTSAKVNYDRLKEILSDSTVSAVKAHDAKRGHDDGGDEDSRLALSGYDDDDYYDDFGEDNYD